MPYDIETVDDGAYVSLVHSGAMSDDEPQRARDEVNTTLRAHQWHKVLVDVSQVTRKPPLLRQFEFLVQHRWTLPANVRIALVVRDEELPGAALVEALSHEHGVTQHVFADRAMALHWLLERR